MPINKEWREKLLENGAQLYMKPTRRKHDSGFRVFEVGYCTIGKGNKVVDKIVLAQYSDHVNTDYMSLIPGELPPICINMDLTVDGYIRIWSSGKETLCWEYDSPMSSATITLMGKNLNDFRVVI